MDKNWLMQSMVWQLLSAIIVTAMARSFKWTTGKSMKRAHELGFWATGIIGLTLVSAIANFGIIKPIRDQLSYEKAIPPELTSEITFLSVAETQPSSPPSIVTLLVQIGNGGGPSFAWKWHLRAEPDRGQALDAEAFPLPTIPMSQTLIENQGVPLDAGHYLPNILLENPVPSGSGKKGWVQFPFNNIQAEELTKYGTTFTLEFQDAAHKKVATTYTINGNVGASEFVFTNSLNTNFPGFRSEFPLILTNPINLISVSTCSITQIEMNTNNQVVLKAQ